MQRFSYLRHPRRLWLIVAALLANAAVCADGPWNEKPPTDWDRSDVHRILYDSPWVKHFTHSKRALEFDVPDQGPSGMELRGYHAKESKEDGSERPSSTFAGYPRALCVRHQPAGQPC